VIVSDFIDGVTLREFLQVRRLTFRESAELLAQVADAVDYAHGMGLVHRDLKPGNIMIELGPGVGLDGPTTVGGVRPLVLDFGLALRDEAEVTMTIEGQILGTPAYMSPEQAAGHGHRVDRRSDVYALGVILYELLCGELPFRGSKGMLRLQVLHDDPRPPRRINDKIPRDLETTCLKAMAREPGRRYGTARELANELRRFLRGEPILARPMGRWERAVRWARRNPVVAGLAAAVLLVLLAGMGVSLYFARESEQHAKQSQNNEADAVAARNDLEKANTGLTQKQDELMTTLARSLLRPLALQVDPHRPLPPLSDPEIEALWEVVASKEERLGARFVQEALRGPVTTRQLKDRAAYALQAAVALDEGRRTQVEGVLGQALQAPGSPPEQQRDIALTLAQVRIQDVALAGKVAATLTQALTKTTDPQELMQLAQGLSAVAAWMEPKEAAATLTQALTRTTSFWALERLAQGLTTVAARLEPKDAREVAATLTQATAKTTDWLVLERLAQGLTAMVTRLEPKEAGAVSGQAAATLTQAMSKTTSFLVLERLARGLAAVAAQMEPKEAAEVCGRAAASLIQAMSRTTNPQALQYLAQGLSAVAAWMEPKEAAEVCGRAAASLIQAMSRTTNPQALQYSTELWILAQGLTAVAAWMEPKEATAVCGQAAATLSQVMSKTTDFMALSFLAQGLSAVAGRMEPKEAAVVCGRAASSLTQLRSRATDDLTVSYLAEAVGGGRPPGAEGGGRGLWPGCRLSHPGHVPDDELARINATGGGPVGGGPPHGVEGGGRGLWPGCRLSHPGHVPDEGPQGVTGTGDGTDGGGRPDGAEGDGSSCCLPHPGHVPDNVPRGVGGTGAWADGGGRPPGAEGGCRSCRHTHPGRVPDDKLRGVAAGTVGGSAPRGCFADQPAPAGRSRCGRRAERPAIGPGRTRSAPAGP
jgi:hypothetical protein